MVFFVVLRRRAEGSGLLSFSRGERLFLELTHCLCQQLERVAIVEIGANHLAARAARPNVGAGPSQSPTHDDLPSFADLTNDEDRERKAETQAPGTYNVVVNPQSFAGLAEYGSATPRRTQSVHSHRSGPSATDSPSASSDASREHGCIAAGDDQNTVVLTRFEDAPLSMPTLSTYPPGRRTSLPETMHRLDITVSPRGTSLPSSRGEALGPGGRNERLMVHYRGFIAKRIMPLGKHFYLDYGAGHEDPIVAEARTFPPVRLSYCLLGSADLSGASLFHPYCAFRLRREL